MSTGDVGLTEDGGEPMIEEDKTWIEDKFNSKVAEIKVEVGEIKLELIQAIHTAIRDLPCGDEAQKRQVNTGRINTIETRMDNGEKFEEKLEKLKNNNSNLLINKLRLIVAISAILAAAWSPHIWKFIKR